MKQHLEFDLNRYFTRIRLTVFSLGLLPLLYLIQGYVRDHLGINPFQVIMSVTGHSALIFLCLSLAITPLRRWLTALFKIRSISHRAKWGKRLSDWNVMIRCRRMIGLYSFFYASLHLFGYLHLELSWLYAELIWEIDARPPILYGIIAWSLLLLLAITSPSLLQRKLKKWWRRIHRLAYPLSLIACYHYLQISKVTDDLPYLYLALLSVLLGHRIVVRHIGKLKRPEDTGMESPPRSKTLQAPQ
jgi:sulfoxide reductase heme-binding subunit YedZ